MQSNRPYINGHCTSDGLLRPGRTIGGQGLSASKLLKVIGLFIAGSVLVQEDATFGFMSVKASRLYQQETTNIHLLSHEVQSEQQLLDLKSDQKEQGIFEKAIQKLQKKEQEEKELKDQQFLVQQSNFIKATRQAMLLASQNSDLEDVQQVMNNMRMGDTRITPSISYEARLKKIAEQQPVYTDEYEGFGSLTEMIKNQDKLADKALQAQQEKSSIEKMKEKMAQALSKQAENQAPKVVVQQPQVVVKPVVKEVVKKEEQQSTQQSKPTDTQANKMEESNKTEEVPANSVPKSDDTTASADDTSNVPKQAADDTQKNLTQLPALPTAPKNSNTSNSAEKPNVPQTSLAESKNNNTPIEKTAQTQSQPTDSQNGNSTTPTTTKLYDNTVSQVIDEVQLEQDAQQGQPTSPETTTIEDDSQQVQVESQMSSDHKKSLVERFKDQVNQDEADNEKAQELVSKMQKKMDTQKKKNVLDRESERLIKEQDDELQLDQELEQKAAAQAS